MVDFCSGVPACDTSVPPSTTVAKNGSSTSDRPNDSITVASSAPPIPAPSYCSSKVSPSRPSWAYCCHSSRLQPSSLSSSFSLLAGS